MNQFKQMKGKVFLFLMAGWMVLGTAAEAAVVKETVVTTSATATVVESKAETSAQKRKRYRGYKKPKSKRFLGIFKRRSSCDCPKH